MSIFDYAKRLKLCIAVAMRPLSYPPCIKSPPFRRRHFQTHFMNLIILFRFEFHLSLFPMVKLTVRQAIAWINADPVHRRIYAALR